MKTTGAEMGIIYVIEAVGGNPEKIGIKYVGKSKNISNSRFNQHKWTLKNKKHHSPKLQNYYNKYGKKSLKFSILGYYPRKELIFWEKFFIKCFDSKNNGFNCREGGDEFPPNPTRECILQNMITNEIVKFDSIIEFAETYKITRSSISLLLDNKMRYVKDWFNPKGQWKPVHFKIISPNKKEYTFLRHRATEFRKKHNLQRSGLFGLLNKRIEAHRGWTRPDSRETNSNASRYTNYKLISPNGTIFEGKNLSKFARDHDLSQACLCKLINGRREEYKNWVLYKEEKI